MPERDGTVGLLVDLRPTWRQIQGDAAARLVAVPLARRDDGASVGGGGQPQRGEAQTVRVFVDRGQ